jgi:aspartate--ammonia ligase
MGDKTADLAGPGIGTYEEVDAGLPKDYESLLTRKETQIAIGEVKRYIEEQLCKKLNLFRIECPLIVETASGMNDYLDRDGSRTPIDFTCGLGLEKRIDAQVVQAATKWKRFALKQFECDTGEGVLTDMRAVRKDYFLDHDHSSYVDQWDWEKVISAGDRNLDTLYDVVKKLWSIFVGADEMLRKDFPKLNTDKYPPIPKELTFLHAEEILDMFPDLPRKQRETQVLQKYPAVFIIGIGHTLDDGYPHEMRAADYDDWTTPTIKKNGKQMHGLNGDILVWNPVTKRRHELSSMGIRVTKDTLVEQLKITSQEHFLELPYHKMIMADEIPLSIGGGIGQSRTYGYLLRKAALGECSVTVWPQQLHDVCAKHNIHLLR